MGIFLCSDCFLERDEEPIKTEEEAWELARKFAGATTTCVNIYVVDENYSPVSGCFSKMLKPY